MSEFRRLALLDAIREAFLGMEPLLADHKLAGIQITIKFGAGGALRSLAIEPEMRFEQNHHQDRPEARSGGVP